MKTWAKDAPSPAHGSPDTTSPCFVSCVCLNNSTEICLLEVSTRDFKSHPFGLAGKKIIHLFQTFVIF